MTLKFRYLKLIITIAAKYANIGRISVLFPVFIVINRIELENFSLSRLFLTVISDFMVQYVELDATIIIYSTFLLYLFTIPF